MASRNWMLAQEAGGAKARAPGEVETLRAAASGALRSGDGGDRWDSEMAMGHGTYGTIFGWL